MTITDPWSPLAAPFDPYDDPFDDAPDCLSRLYVPEGSLSLGPLSCTVDHRASGLDWLHGTVLAGCSVEWTSAEAEASRAAYRAAAAPCCTECPRPAVVGGVCGYHRGAELAADDYETSEVEAA